MWYICENICIELCIRGVYNLRVKWNSHLQIIRANIKLRKFHVFLGGM